MNLYVYTSNARARLAVKSFARNNLKRALTNARFKSLRCKGKPAKRARAFDV